MTADRPSGRKGERSERKPGRAQPSSDEGSGLSLEKAAKAFQENVTRAGPVAAASYTLIGAIILLGGIGYAVDRWRGTSPWFLLAGLILGIIVGFYELAKAVWPKQ
jgi:F0F1-type ATP synthase assembly protein I